MFDEIRIQQLADNIHQDLKLLKEYEDELRYTSEPRLKGRYEREIQRQRESLSRNQKEYEHSLQSLQQAIDAHPVPEPVMQETLDAVSQIFSEITATKSGRFDSRLITDVAIASEVVDDPKLDVGHKLKVSIPIIPLILSYEGEIDLKSGLNLKKERLQDLEENMEQDLKLLKEYEKELRFETDPRRLGDIRRNIQRQHESVREYRQEYEELQKIATSAQVQNISDLLQQQEAKLDEVNKLLPPIWNVSHIRNTHFTGREDILSELRAALTSGEPAAWKQAVTGMGGVGKTQIALEYIYRHMAKYQIIWWIRSEELATMAPDYANLAEPLGLPEKDSIDQTEIVRAVKSWLEHNSGWLLIFDNAQDHLP